MTEFLQLADLEVYFIENPFDAEKIAEQVLINKRSRESAEKARLNIKKKLSGTIDIANRVQKFVDCRTKDVSRREIYIVEGDSALGSVQAGPGCGVSGDYACTRKDPQLPERRTMEKFSKARSLPTW